MCSISLHVLQIWLTNDMHTHSVSVRVPDSWCAPCDDLSGSTAAVAATDGSGGFTKEEPGQGERATVVKSVHSEEVAGGRDSLHSGSDVTARMNPFGFSFFLFSFPPAFCFSEQVWIILL